MDDRDLDLKYRPRTYDEFVGQADAIKAIKSWGKNVPRCVLFFGGPGCGKTSMARILAKQLGSGNGDVDCREVNCGALESPSDYVKDLASNMGFGSLSGGKRIWIFEEMQTFSRSKGAQEGLLPVLESSPEHNQFIITTTEPQRLIKPIRSRCVHIELKPIKAAELTALVIRIAKAEGIALSDDVVERIVELANGGARDAVKGLQKIIGLTDPDDQLAALGGIDAAGDVFEIVRALLYSGGRPSWAKVAEQLKIHEEADPESVRLMIINAARTTLLKGGANAQNAYKAIICFEKPFFDRGSGKALLAAYAYEYCKPS